MRAASIYPASIFLSALLLFSVEPMVGRMLLPRFGGSPAVWSTCLLFFQVALLAGYAYAHVSVERLAGRAQLVVHALVVLAPLALGPPAIGARFAPAPGAWPVGPLALALTASVGLPFVALATNASLAQRWYARATGRAPWFLYAASNAGSFVALLAYPLVVEPRLGLAAQANAWRWGYAGFAVLTLAGMALAARARPETAPAERAPLPRGARLRWTVRAFVPSALLLAVSLRVSTDIAAMPLLWVVPLALYLLSFVLAFSSAPFPRRAIALVATACALALLGTLSTPPREAMWAVLPLPLAALFFGCWLCHGDLARDRPPPSRLTAYYLWIAIGGALGGVACNLLAPLVFRSVAEYPLALAALVACAGSPPGRARALVDALRRWSSWMGAGIAAALLAAWALDLGTDASEMYLWLPLGLLALSLALARALPAQPLVSAALVAALAVTGLLSPYPVLDARRNFFGILRVLESDGTRTLVNGTTTHGAQIVAPLDRTPVSYYHPETPMGAAVARLGPGARIAVVGLGTGSLAALTKPGQALDYYEIDPVAEPLARRWFTFLGDARADLRVVLGDARLTLARAAPAAYDLVVIDAFSSDAVPVHLLTVEAVAMYLDKLGPDGLLLLHVSSRHLDLVRVARGVARGAGAAIAMQDFVPDDALLRKHVSHSQVVALSRSAARIARLIAEPDAGWEALEPGPEAPWTDDRSSLFGVLHW